MPHPGDHRGQQCTEDLALALPGGPESSGLRNPALPQPTYAKSPQRGGFLMGTTPGWSSCYKPNAAVGTPAYMLPHLIPLPWTPGLLSG